MTELTDAPDIGAALAEDSILPVRRANAAGLRKVDPRALARLPITPTIIPVGAGALDIAFSKRGAFVVTATGDMAIPSPAGAVVGAEVDLYVIQDGVGGRVLSLGAQFEIAPGAGLSSEPGAIDRVSFTVLPSGVVWASITNFLAPSAGGGTVLNGPLPPTDAQGSNGDFWFVVDVFGNILSIYGPKLSGTWPNAFIVPQGAPGAGATTLTASIAPIPAVNASVNIEVADAAAFADGSFVFIANSNTQELFAQVTAIISPNDLTIKVLKNVNDSASMNAGAIVTFAGVPAVVSVGTVTASAPGSQPYITNSGVPAAAVLDFVLPRGDPGSTTLVGSTVPTGGTGQNGDVYYRINAGVVTFYGAKTAGAWPAGIVLNAAGPAGLAGAGSPRPGTISNSATNSDNLNFTAYRMPDSTGLYSIAAPAYTQKSILNAWTAGSNGGLLDTGTVVPNSTAHIYVMCKSDGTQGDYIASASPAAPTLPAAYVGGYFVRIASIPVTGINTFVNFAHLLGNVFLLTAPVLDLAAAASTTTVATRTLSVPVGVRVEAMVRINGSAVFTAFEAIGTPIVPAAGAFSTAGGSGFDINTSSSSQDKRVLTNLLAQVQSVSGSTGTISCWTKGWVDPGILIGR